MLRLVLGFLPWLPQPSATLGGLAEFTRPSFEVLLRQNPFPGDLARKRSLGESPVFGFGKCSLRGIALEKGTSVPLRLDSCAAQGVRKLGLWDRVLPFLVFGYQFWQEIPSYSWGLHPVHCCNLLPGYLQARYQLSHASAFG